MKRLVEKTAADGTRYMGLEDVPEKYGQPKQHIVKPEGLLWSMQGPDGKMYHFGSVFEVKEACRYWGWLD